MAAHALASPLTIFDFTYPASSINHNPLNLSKQRPANLSIPFRKFSIKKWLGAQGFRSDATFRQGAKSRCYVLTSSVLESGAQ
jgi:hypothetical protein